MKSIKYKIVFPLSLLLFLSGCMIPPSSFKPVISHGVWEKTTYEKVFDGCVRTLHIKGYMILAAGKDTGLISVDWKEFRTKPNRSLIGKYRFNLLVFESAGNTATVSVKINASWYAEKGHSISNKNWANQVVNDEISEYLQNLFLEFERVIGKPSSTGQTAITWE